MFRNFVAVGICFQFDFFYSFPRSSRMNNTADLESASEWPRVAEFSATDTSDGKSSERDGAVLAGQPRSRSGSSQRLVEVSSIALPFTQFVRFRLFIAIQTLI